MKFKNLIGQKFGRYLVLELAETKNKRIRWLCKCDCGEERIVQSNNLISGQCQSCGCLNKEVNRTRMTTHGMCDTKEYSIWSCMINRCYDVKNNRYYRYGARGITVCDRWRLSFENFFEDMGHTPSEEHTIERDNVNGNYELSNCRWLHKDLQPKNTSRTHWVEFEGERIILSDVCRKLHTKPNIFCQMLKRKSVEEVLEYFKNKLTQ